MVFVIRPLEPGDVAEIEQLAYTYNCELDAEVTRMEAVKRWIAHVQQEAAARRHFFWLAWVDDQVAGFISFQLRHNPFTRETYGFIEDMYIAPTFRRCGYAHALAQAAYTELTNQGAYSIQLDVLANNKAALAFWQKLGLTLHHYVLSMPLAVPRNK
ncbi:GNAT family N-acetyltransferase [Ktedonosporobacter rubrisoli]|uniref:GNAT family N-acetyltransferase n=1 Tax=Ktedonosporobacter rubrisoli TaxID=2509675 RepID=A0A4P6JJ58_KTERU|nr:GNAT family N-acetyltransferase [Ktedonosporobacter rubrisoli]QBD74696.1 GNAT family N-acetyltransferase [Ktedonosporobacter rubrisoli]